jgi:ATP-dependent RNA helicase DDX52/ROK1
VQSKERAKELFFELRKILREVMGCTDRVEYVTGEKAKGEREAVIQRFQRGEIWALVATDLIARGIDFKGVNLVVNYDFPNSMLTYIHRVGRTGRADRTGTAITFYCDEDRNQLRSLGNLLKISGC